MTRQGLCLDATQAPVNILDRLEGLSKVVPPEVMEQALSETGMSGQRSCKLSHRVMLWIVLAMGLLTHLPIRQVFKHAHRMRPNEKTPSRSNLCEARQRLGVEPVRRVFELVVHPLATPETPGAFYKGYRLMGIDGTVMDVPDSPANEERFGRSSGGRGDAAFPQIRKLSLVELGTHVETALAIGGYHDSEQKLVVQLFDKIPDDALLLEDRNFFSYDHWKELDSRGVKLAPGNGFLSTTAGFNPHGCSMAQDNQPDLQVEGWLKTLGIESLCQWDVLVFLYRHQPTLVRAEHIAHLLGDATAEVVAALDSLESTGLVQPSRVSQGVHLYQLTAPANPTRRDAWEWLMTLADSHTVRLFLGRRLRGDDRPDQNKKPVRLRGVESSES